MNVCILQPLFPKEAAEASGFIDWILGELDRCDDTLDLIVLPEYSNAPSVYPWKTTLPIWRLSANRCSARYGTPAGDAGR